MTLGMYFTVGSYGCLRTLSLDGFTLEIILSILHSVLPDLRARHSLHPILHRPH
jgi:hypothetical protein